MMHANARKGQREKRRRRAQSLINVEAGRERR